MYWVISVSWDRVKFRGSSIHFLKIKFHVFASNSLNYRLKFKFCQIPSNFSISICIRKLDNHKKSSFLWISVNNLLKGPLSTTLSATLHRGHPTKPIITCFFYKMFPQVALKYPNKRKKERKKIFKGQR